VKHPTSNHRASNLTDCTNFELVVVVVPIIIVLL